MKLFDDVLRDSIKKVMQAFKLFHPIFELSALHFTNINVRFFRPTTPITCNGIQPMLRIGGNIY